MKHRLSREAAAFAFRTSPAAQIHQAPDCCASAFPASQILLEVINPALSRTFAANRVFHAAAVPWDIHFEFLRRLIASPATGGKHVLDYLALTGMIEKVPLAGVIGNVLMPLVPGLDFKVAGRAPMQKARAHSLADCARIEANRPRALDTAGGV